MNIKYYSFLFSLFFSLNASAALQTLDDEQLSEISGQALLTVDRFDYAGNNFYQIKLNGSLENNINIGKLLLSDSSGAAQIDIDNFSLSGDAAGISDGNLSSATLTNPFVEVAFAGLSSADNAQNREIIGFRVGADNMEGFMSFGSQDDESGLNKFRGYMKTGPLRGRIRTRDSGGGFSTASDLTTIASRTGSPGFAVNAYACLVIIGSNCSAGSTGQNPNSGDINVDVLIPNGAMHFSSVSIGTEAVPIVLKAAGITINTSDGIAVSQTLLQSDILKLPGVPFRLTGAGAATATYDPTGFAPITINLDVDVISIGTLGNEATGQQLEAISNITQDLRYIHRAQVSGDGFYMSAQNRPISWRNAPTGDVAQAGWWMSIKDEVSLGDVFVDGITLPDESLRQITQRTSDVLYVSQRLGIPVADAFGTVTTDLGVLAFDNSTISPIDINLGSQNLGPNQAHIVNCWNGAIGC